MSDRGDTLERMILDLRMILAILVIAGWSDEQIHTLVAKQYELAKADPERAAPVRPQAATR